MASGFRCGTFGEVQITPPDQTKMRPSQGPWARVKTLCDLGLKAGGLASKRALLIVMRFGPCCVMFVFPVVPKLTWVILTWLLPPSQGCSRLSLTLQNTSNRPICITFDPWAQPRPLRSVAPNLLGGGVPAPHEFDNYEHKHSPCTRGVLGCASCSITGPTSTRSA